MLPTSPIKSSLWKGKAKVPSTSTSDPDFTDLNPVITYRHILSNNPGVKDPLRVVALCDSDAFYAGCEMVRLNSDREQPLVVLQWDSLIAVNYPARKYGITRMIRLKDALKKCPHLKVVHVATYKEGEKEPGYWDNIDSKTHKVSLDYYRRESVRVASAFKDALPSSVEIEKASIDEAFFDYTKTVKEILLQRYPYLANVPEDDERGIDTPLPYPPRLKWSNLNVGCIVPLRGTPEPEPEPKKTEESNVEVESTINEGEHKHKRGESRHSPKKQTTKDHDELYGLEDDEDDQYTNTWHDVALSVAAQLMDDARAKVRELGYTTSAGIARNKFLAKLSASYKKPNGQSILRNQAIPSYLRPLAFQKIRFLGGKLGKALAQEFDASTVGDLLTISLEEMQRKFGEESIWVYEVLRGIDRSEVKEKSAINKSMLAAKNLQKPIKNVSEGYHWIRVLAADLTLRLNDARQATPNLWPKSICLNARKGYDPMIGYENGRSKQAPFPFVRELSVDVVAHAGDKLWKILVGANKVLDISHVALSFTGLEASEQGQRSIEGFLKPVSAKKRTREEDTLDRAVSVECVIEDSDTEVQEAIHHQVASSSHTSSWTCSRCRKTFDLSEFMSGIDGAHDEALATIRREHEDFHFAEDLEKQYGEPSVSVVKSSSKSSNSKLQKRSKKKQPKGLEKYFSRK